MGAVTKGGNDNDGIVDCVILSMFMDSDPQIGQRYRSIEVEDTLEARRTGLNKGADAFIALPGGLGTLDELTEVMCMRQLSFHERPIVLINTASFYDPIRQFLESGVEKRFIAADVRRTIHFADTPEEAIAFLKTYKPTKIDKETINSSELRKTT